MPRIIGVFNPEQIDNNGFAEVSKNLARCTDLKIFFVAPSK